MRKFEIQAKRSLLVALLICVGGIVYGSLIPFDFQPHSIEQAWRIFLHAPWLEIGVRGRADWVANLLIYIPLAFLFCAVVTSLHANPAARVAGVLLAFIASVSLAIGIEFVQVFFPPRTVSLNDIVAESIGSGLGVVLWWSAGDRFSRLFAAAQGRGYAAVTALLTCYMLAYLTLSLYPYDFLISDKELAAKFDSGTYGLLVAPHACHSLFVCILKLAAEALAVVPFGIWLRLRWKGGFIQGARRALIQGALLGLVIEAGQFLTESGISQGISVVTRAAGFCLGYGICYAIQTGAFERYRSWLRPIIGLAALPYLAVLALANSLHVHHWLSWPEAVARIKDVNYLPFYYYYFSTENHAMFSLLAVAGLYAPIGVAAWAWTATRIRNDALDIRLVAFGGAVICALFEFMKLFAASKHPDPTDVLIAAAGAVLGFGVFRIPGSWFYPAAVALHPQFPAMPVDVSRRKEESAGGIPVVPSGSRVSEEAATNGVSRPVVYASPGMSDYLISAVALVVIVAAVYRYPLSGWVLGIGLLAYAAVLWFYPTVWLAVLPALLPVMDFGPWSGWIFLDEFDLFVLVTIGVCYPRLRPLHSSGSALDRTAVGLIGALTLSYVISMLIGLLPLQPLDDNAFSTYLSHYNSLRVAKGFFLALLLFPLLRRTRAVQGVDDKPLFLLGTVVGVGGLVVVVLWERFLFPGLFNFSNNYRVTTLFSGMQTGGPQVETYIALTAPFIAAWFLLKPSLQRFIVALVLYAGAAYAMLVTYSRAGYLALVVVTFLVALGALASRRHDARWRWGFLAALVIALMGVVTPIVRGSFSESRLAHSGSDLDVRFSHWRADMSMRDPGLVTRLFGMGLGSFPATYYMKNTQGVRPGNFSFRRERDNRFLRLGGGDSLYMGQRVTTTPHTPYVLSLDVRNPSPVNTVLKIFVCEKQLLYSYRCQGAAVKVPAAEDSWQHRDLILDTGDVGIGHWYTRRPVEFSLSDPLAGSLIDVDNVRLLAPDGANLIANGDFSRGADRWFFTTDDGWPWRIENVWLQILFEQGWYGVAVFSMLVAFIGYRLGLRFMLGDVYAVALLAAITGALTIGLFSSSFVSSRIALLFYVLIFIGALHVSGFARVDRTRQLGASVLGARGYQVRE